MLGVFVSSYNAKAALTSFLLNPTSLPVLPTHPQENEAQGSPETPCCCWMMVRDKDDPPQRGTALLSVSVLPAHA